ncbi:type II secretory pathway component PulK-like pr otein [Desulfonema ishimotonii]|uniref:Type II secretory pathway component PulK-like pr otein n=1 Tax=Desulfonema ishimotonii TaxID=45657 RepID=A0A401G499_9BACT|nr:general secretion pathway protein GspK [Desulfonema ishimotonii]GBC64062.1 type II secretory pathway component PulK-like pr otein [Desulfonema ishimotonii]
MGLQPLGNDRGMALLLTLTITALLITGALEMNRRVRASVISAAVARDRLTLNQMAAAGIHGAMAMLIKDKTEASVDSVQEDWADPEKVAEVLQDIPFEAGKLTVSIRDEMGKIQVNALIDFPKGRHFNESQKIMWDRFIRLLLARDEDEETFKDLDATAIINAVKDWLDSGDDDATTGLNGAESEYYEGLDPPYSPRNGPFTHLDELMQVKGITPELFNGLEAAYGLDLFMTICGGTQSSGTVENRNFTFEGKVNINTASLPVLMALVPSENPEYAQAIYDYRNETEDGEFIHDLSGGTWYKNVPDIPGDMTIDPALITTSSDFFRIVSTAELHDVRQTVTAVIHREQALKTGKWTCRVLSWQVD